MHLEIIDLRPAMWARQMTAELTGDPIGATELRDEDWDDRVTVEPSAEAPNGWLHEYQDAAGPEHGQDFEMKAR